MCAYGLGSSGAARVSLSRIKILLNMSTNTDTIRPTHGLVLNDAQLVYDMLEAPIDDAKPIENRCFGFPRGWHIVSLAKKPQHSMEDYTNGCMHGAVFISHALKQNEVQPPSKWQDRTGRWGVANIISKRLLVKNGPRVRGNFGRYPLKEAMADVYAAVDKALREGACIEDTHAESRWPARKATAPTPKRRPPKASLSQKATTSKMPAVAPPKPPSGAIRKRSPKTGALKQTTLTDARRIEQ